MHTMSKRIFVRSKTMHFSHKHNVVRMLFGMCALLAGLLFAACSSSFEEDTAQTSEPSIDVIVTNYATHKGFNALLSPGTYAKDNIQKFTVDGEDRDGATFTGTAIAIDESGIGKINNISKTLWNLTLHAYSDTAGTNEVLRGYAVADTRNGDVTVSFTLSSYAVTTPGSFSLTFAYTNESIDFSTAVTEVDLTVCDHETHAALYAATVTSTADLASWADGGYTFAKTNMTPGYYYLQVLFKNGATQIGMYTDVLDIQPGRATEKDVTITNELYTKPAAPQNVKVYRVDDSQTADYYTAVIRWDDVATNEEYYQIAVYKYASATQSTGTPVTTIAYNNYNTISLSDENSMVGYVSGNLWYGSQEYAVRLRTGVLYDFTVAAVNTIGSSEATARIAADDIANDNTFKSALTGYGVSASDADKHLRVNTFAVTYSLNNGTWKIDAANTKTGTIIDYDIYANEDIALRAPKTIDVNEEDELARDYPILYLGDITNPFVAWKKDSIAGGTITTATACENLFVIATYDVQEDSAYDIEFDNTGLSLTASNADSTNTAIISSGNQINSTSYSTVTVTVDTDKNSNFRSFTVYINGTEQGDATVNSDGTATYTFPIPFKGTYTVQVAGIYNNTHYYSKEYTFSVN